MGPAASHGFYICSGKSFRYLWSKLFLLAALLGPFLAHTIPKGLPSVGSCTPTPPGTGDGGRGVQPGAAGTRGGFGGPELLVSFCVIWIQILRNQRSQSLAKGLHSTSAKVSLLSRKESALTDSHEFVTSSGTGKELLKFEVPIS